MVLGSKVFDVVGVLLAEYRGSEVGEGLEDGQQLKART